MLLYSLKISLSPLLLGHIWIGFGIGFYNNDIEYFYLLKHLSFFFSIEFFLKISQMR